MMETAVAVSVGSGTPFVLGVITAQAIDGTSTQDLFVQTAGLGVALAVGMWMLRRYDSRADAAQARADQLLREEREAHAETRARLEEALKER